MAEETGTPDPGAAAAAEPAGDDGEFVRVPKQEFGVWKGKAEKFNELDERAKQLAARNAELERLAYGRGATVATDPVAETVSALQEAQQYDVNARGTLLGMQEAWAARKESTLATDLMSVPESKREKVVALVRGTNYRATASQALAALDNPEEQKLTSRVQELEAELARVKAKPAGEARSPAAITPSDTAGAQPDEPMAWSAAKEVLARGGEEAIALRKKMDGKKQKIDYSK